MTGSAWEPYILPSGDLPAAALECFHATSAQSNAPGGGSLSVRPPDGIEERHWLPASRRRQAQGPLATSILTVIVIAGLLGLFGLPDQTRTASVPRAELAVYGPRLIRNGEFFEMRLRVRARRGIAEPVIAVGTEVWRDITINTMIPAATEEEYANGEYRFTFGSLDAGEELVFKVDAQINPNYWGSSSDQIRLLGGNDPITGVRYDLMVLP